MRKIRLNTIAKKLCFAVTVKGVVLSVLISCIIFPIVFNSLEKKTINNISGLCEQSMSYIDSKIDQYELYSRFIRNDEYLFQLIDEYTADSSVKNRERISTKLSSYVNTFSDVSGVSLQLDEDTYFENIGNSVSSDTILNSEWYRNYKKNGYSRQFSDEVDRTGEAASEGGKGGYLFLIYPYSNRFIMGDIIFLLPLSVFDEAVKPYVDNDMNVIIFGRNNMPFYEYRNDGGTSLNIQRVKEHISGGGFKQYEISENEDGLDMISYSELGGLKLAVHVSDSYIIGDFKFTLILLYFLLMFMFFVFVIVILEIITKRIRPLHKMTEQIENVSEDRLDIVLDVRSGDELETLAGAFNEMISKIKLYLAERIEYNNQQRQLEYSLFLAQIDPHFIYKTLNVITYLAKKKDTELLINVNNSLINILRDRLRISTIDSMDTIQKEIQLVESYLTIQRVRYGDCIRLEKEVDDNILDELVPKNVIQNFVENAVYHGILLNVDESMNIAEGIIQLKITDLGSSIELQITDNGQGMTDDTVSKYFIEDFSINVGAEKGKHTGIKNVTRTAELSVRK